MKRKLILAAGAAGLALVLGTAALSAGSAFPMTYLPGTTDPSASVPAEEDGINGTAFAVSDEVPTRDGYEFIDYTLDTDIEPPLTVSFRMNLTGVPGDVVLPDDLTDIEPGSDVTLPDLTSSWTTFDGEPVTETEYIVKYLDVGTNSPVEKEKKVTGDIGDLVTELAVDVSGMMLVGDDSQSLELKQTHMGEWTFEGWYTEDTYENKVTKLSDLREDTTLFAKWSFTDYQIDRNEIIFYYDVPPAPALATYRVVYIDADRNEEIAESKIVTDVEEGSVITEYALDIRGYIPYDKKLTWVVFDGDVMVFVYYEDYAPLS